MTLEDTLRIPVGNLCNLISIRLRDTWDFNIPGNEMELRFTDLWGDAFQLDMDRTTFLRLWMFGDLAGSNSKLPTYTLSHSPGAQGTRLFLE